LKKIVAALTFAVLALAAASTASAAPRDGGLLGLGLGGSNCPSSGTQVFAPWHDYNPYYLAPNGGLENGSTGWRLNGAYVVSGNEPFYASGSHSLSLPSGSSATSPTVCIGPKDLYIRMFGNDLGGRDSGLHVRVLWYGLLNQLLGSSDFETFKPGGGWDATSPVDSSGGGDVLIPLLGSTSARVQLYPIGSGSSWLIDDVEIDPWASQCC
jgi:hypothetical protein